MTTANPPKTTQETKAFTDKVNHPHRRINPCFMTGQGCVYTEQIEGEIKKREALRKPIIAADANGHNPPTPEEQSYARSISGFTVIPFKPNFLTFYNLCLSRYLTGDYDMRIGLAKADSVRKTGYVICEKICKKIQESDFILGDISVPNPNVFYELGLAYGSEQKIVLIANQGSVFADQVSKHFDARLLPYPNLGMLTQENFPLSQKIWQLGHIEPPLENKTLLLIEEDYINERIPLPKLEPADEAKPAEKKEGEKQEDKQLLEKVFDWSKVSQDIKLNFPEHVRAALGVAIDNIVKTIEPDKNGNTPIPLNYHDWIRRLKGIDSNLMRDRKEGIQQAEKASSFTGVREMINEAFCVLIKTGKDCHPMMYFWLGYCHALGKNVIPITAVDSGEIKPNESKTNDSIDDLAFDIRALWHVVFDRHKPEELTQALEETLYQMIYKDFSEWARKHFWDKILDKRGEVSIFTGALHNEAIGREMIGDWDLRAASELTSYFASHQYRAKIESPVYHFDRVKNMGKEEYIQALIGMLQDKNCVIIASPDVNPLAEIVLGQIYGLPHSDWFNRETNRADLENNAVVAFKQLDPEQAKQPRKNLTFYREEPLDEESYQHNPELKRGFITRILGALVPKQRIEGTFISQMMDENSDFKVHAHLAVVPNPFVTKPGNRNYIVLLNGVSGPATFALTHMLTGPKESPFASYHPADGVNFDPSSESEKILQILLTRLMETKGIVSSDNTRSGIQCIVEVKVGKASDQQASPFDWRHIKSWILYPEFKPEEGKKTEFQLMLDRVKPVQLSINEAPASVTNHDH